MATIFTKIISGEIPCYKVAENDHFIAFLDINPNTLGHTLCVPKAEVNKLFDLDRETYAGLMEFARNVAVALEKTVACERIGMAVIGLEVPHVHVHLIPINTMRDMTFQNKTTVSDEEMTSLAKAISENL